MAEHPHERHPRQAKRRLPLSVWALFVVVLVVASVCIWWWWPRPSPPAHTLSIQEKLYLLTQTRHAIGLLENETDLSVAVVTFGQLAEKLPQERLPWQNGAIARILLMKQQEQSEEQVILEAQHAVEQLMERFPSAEAYWLAAQFIARLPRIDEAQKTQKIVELLEKAQAADPQNAIYPMGIYEALVMGGRRKDAAKMRDALRAAYEKAPDNLHVLVEWLVIQAEAQDTTIRQTLLAARQLVAPLWRSILGGDNLTRDDAVSSLGRNVLEMLDEAVAAVEAANWQQVQILTLQIRNGIGPLIVHRNDTGRISPHPLSFVVQDYSDTFYQDLPPPQDDMVKVRFSAPLPLVFDGLPPDDPIVDLLLADFDLDGADDWIILTDSHLHVYQGRRDESPGALIAKAELSNGMQGVVLGDLDNDHLAARAAPPAGPQSTGDKPQWHQADLDLIAFGTGGVWVLENQKTDQGSRQLLVRAQPDISQMPQDIVAAVLVDFDHDADLDLVLATGNGLLLWSGRGNATFEDLTSYSVLPENVIVRRLIPVDWDRDGDTDMVCLAEPGPPILLENRLHGHFTWKPLQPRVAEGLVHDLAVAELDGNGSWDLAFAVDSGLFIQWTQTALGADVRWQDSTAVSTAAFSRFVVGDLDNNGFLDLLAWNENQVQVFRGAPRRAMTPWDVELADLRPAQLHAYDVDRDGDLDLVFIQNGQAAWVRNEGGNTNGWLQLRLVGQCDNKGCAGHTGIGTLVELKTGNHYQAQTVLADSIHFGLGSNLQADVVRIVWTNGVPQTIVQPEANQYVTELMTLKGSCPYLYTWNGERFVFVTDCLWAAPLGMQSARGVLAPCRPWEYLKVSGELLQPRNGYYEIRLTEELWEAAYFDHVELLAVDHPADVNIFSNEKVGPADIAAFQVHTVRQPLRPIAAFDQRGRDVLPLIIAEDDQYLAAWDRRLAQGVTEKHFLELDLGPLSHPRKILLYLTGWIYPANTSLNVAFSSHPQLDAPCPPSIWTPDAQGRWREVLPFMGFPGGKTKTIVVDVSKLFTPGDYRLRIVTTAELYWDGVFFTVDEEPADMHIHRIGVSEAHLHYRGFSRRIPYHHNRPERYVYEEVELTPRWPTMRGKFTRYGDVTELLHTQDNRLVVLGAGDELAIRFAVPAEPVPAGWKRDFLLYCVGWDKDADLNTICGQTVEPLPYHGMVEYPYDPKSAPQDAAYLEYLRRYQTREQVPARFWKAIQFWSPSP